MEHRNDGLIFGFISVKKAAFAMVLLEMLCWFGIALVAVELKPDSIVKKICQSEICERPNCAIKNLYYYSCFYEERSVVLSTILITTMIIGSCCAFLHSTRNGSVMFGIPLYTLNTFLALIWPFPFFYSIITEQYGLSAILGTAGFILILAAYITYKFMSFSENQTKLLNCRRTNSSGGLVSDNSRPINC